MRPAEPTDRPDAARLAMQRAATGLLLAMAVVFIAARMWADVVAKAPHNARGHYNLGCALLESGGAENEDRALARFLEALRLRPEYPGAHNNAGTVLFRRGRYEEAAEHFRAGLAPGDPPFEALRNYGNVLMELARHDEAAAVLRRAEERLRERPIDDATAARLWCDIGLCLARSGAPDEALPHFRRAVETDPGLATAWLNLAALLGAKGQLPGAIDAYLAAIAAEPSSAKARVEVLALCLDARHRAAARAHLEELVRSGPSNAEAARVLEFVRRAR